MTKIKLNVSEIREKIKSFYNKKEWHFLTLNGVALDEALTEVQWIFARYSALDDIVIFYVEVKHDVVLPTIEDLIPSAIIAQRELVDMFGIEVVGSEKGLYLDNDSESMPLSGCNLSR
jgi:ech hydrogenase subunit D